MKHTLFLLASLALATSHADNAAAFGGLVDVPPRGTVGIVNCRTELQEADIRGFFVISDKVFPLGWKFLTENAGFSVSAARGLCKRCGSNATIFLVDDPSLPMTLVAIEDKWGLINLSPLTADKPKTVVLCRRAEKLFTRVATQLLGGGMSMEIPFSAMKPVFSVDDLDKMDAKAIAPSHLMQMSAYGKCLGLERPYRVNYYEACMLNCAPAPTNDLQRAIWDNVHTPPKTPIKIEYDPKKGR